MGPKKAQKWPKNGRPCNYINPYHPILAPPKKCKNVHFLGPKKGVIFTRALFTRLFYLYFWRTGGDIFGKGEKTAPRGHFSTFFPVLAGVMGLSTPKMGGLKDAFFGPKNPKNGHVLAHPIHPGNGPRFLAKNCPKITGGTRRSDEEKPASSMGSFLLILSSFFFHLLFVGSA